MSKALRIVAVFDLTRADGPEVDEREVVEAFTDDELPALTGVYVTGSDSETESHYEVEVVVADIAPPEWLPGFAS